MSGDPNDPINLANAARMRDAINAIIDSYLQNERPPPVQATVVSADTGTHMAMVIYPGEVVPVPVKMYTLEPLPGAVVWIDGPADGRYISDIVSGNFQISQLEDNVVIGAPAPGDLTPGGGGSQGPTGPMGPPGITGARGAPGSPGAMFVPGTQPQILRTGRGTENWIYPGVTTTNWSFGGRRAETGHGGNWLGASTGLATTDISGLPGEITNGGATNIAFFSGPANANCTHFWSQANGLGGFIFSMSFGFTTLPPTVRFFAGLHQDASQGGTINNTSLEPSTGTNFAGICQDTTSAHPTFVHNDDTGISTKVVTGMSPIVVDRLYEIVIISYPITGNLFMSFEAFNQGNSFEYQEYITATDVPKNSAVFTRTEARPYLTVHRGAGGVSPGNTRLLLFHIYMEKQPYL